MVRLAGKAPIDTRPAPPPATRPVLRRPTDQTQGNKASRIPGQAGSGRSSSILTVASELLEAFRAGEGVDLIRESVRLACRT